LPGGHDGPSPCLGLTRNLGPVTGCVQEWGGDEPTLFAHVLGPLPRLVQDASPGPRPFRPQHVATHWLGSGANPCISDDPLPLRPEWPRHVVRSADFSPQECWPTKRALKFCAGVGAVPTFLRDESRAP
jgi:hypothetical protein